MKMHRLASYSTIFAMLALAAPFAANAADQVGSEPRNHLSVTLGVDYANGDYGTGITTDAVATKLKVTLLPTDRIDLSLEIPYLYQSNGLTTSFGTGRYRTSGSHTHMMGETVHSAAAGVVSTSDLTRAQNGIGDLILRGGYIVMKEQELIPQIRPEFYVKFPTADSNKGLGTGEFDGGVGVTLVKWLGNWYGALEGVYNFIGKSADFNLNNYFSYEADLGYRLTERFLPVVAVKGATRASSDSSSYCEMRVGALYRISGHWGIDGYLGKGLTDTSPDYTAGAEITYQF